MKVLLIDSDAPRRDALEKQIVGMGYDCDSYAQVNGEAGIVTNTLWRDLEQKAKEIALGRDYDVLLIHHNHNQNPFWDSFARLCCEIEDMWCVSYSGGLTAESVHQKHHAFLGNVTSAGRASWDLLAFFRSVESGESNPFRALTRFDPVLEAKLEFLHTCLTPPKDDNIKSKLIQLKAQIESRGFELDSKVLHAKWRDEKDEAEFSGSFDEALETLSEETDCFSPKYVAILSELRNHLLVE